jgi:tetratricopeptide (TPR) repeat protein
MDQAVSAWVEKITIPTYAVGTPEKNPIFLERRVYQGSKGSVYPHPIIETISDKKGDQEYTAVFLENPYLKIMVLPQLGGRIQRAYDKIRKRDFIYYNQVIKPALVGLTGPWISGGIEFNWPQHHRPSTFDPVDFTLAENADGSKTVWVNEVEAMSRTKGMAGFTLYPDKAYLEVKGRLYNRSLFPQTFLWWANPAIKVNEHTQSIFPPDVYAVFDHGKRDVSGFPIATGTYYRVNYAPGTDISLYKNIPVPTSYMAIQSQYNFIGSYENDTQAGMLHVADHHFSPGKKQWTWGTGDFGKAWERNLTDEDGPYIELMCGVYTDNQPDFSWIGPNEEKSFEQYFLPYAGIGYVKNATKEAAINVEVFEKSIVVKIYATATYPDASICLTAGKENFFKTSCSLSPETFFEQTVPLPPKVFATDLTAEVRDAAGKLLVQYKQKDTANNKIPEPATAALPPSQIESNELLFLNGLHLEQYRHATYNPTDYYGEGLRRDSHDVRCNNAMGLWLLRRGKFIEAENHFEKAISRLVSRNPNPYESEPYYNLGLCLMLQERIAEAYDAFYKSAWNDAMQHSAYFQLARLAVRNRSFDEALYLIEKSLVKNYHSHSARHLKTAILRKMNSSEAAMGFLKSSLEVDPFNFGCHFEHHLLLKDLANDAESSNALNEIKRLMRGSFNNYIEYALDYIHAGLFDEAIQLLLEYEKDKKEETPSPLLFYYLGWLFIKSGAVEKAMHYFEQAAAAPPDYCFPSKIEDIAVLETAIANNASDFKAPYYLGNFWYANGQYAEAIACWERSVAGDHNFPTAHRNLSLAYYNKLHNWEKAIAALQTAFYLNTKDARVLMELDQLYKLSNHCHWQRLQLLEDHITLVEQRDDLYLERITLYNQLGDFETALALIAKHKFHPWEGGEGKVVSQFLLCHIELAKAAMVENRYLEALVMLDATDQYPHNLGEGKLPGTQENDIHYLKGLAYSQIGDAEQANAFFLKATIGETEPVQAIFYNDPQPDKIFYQGLAWLKLGAAEKAEKLFNRLSQFAAEHGNDEIKIDYFAVSLPDLQVFDQDLNRKNKIHCHYLTGLGLLGLNRTEQAKASFKNVLELDCNHQGAITHLNMIPFIQQHGH